MGKKTAILALLTALVLSSCQKSGVPAYVGSYSFKTGGYVTIEGKVKNVGKDTIIVRDTSFTRSLFAESGQMHIAEVSENTFKLTMNISGGNPVVFDGVLDDNLLKLSGTTRQATFVPELESALDETVSLIVKVDGLGKKYDNIMIFDFNYEGKYVVGKISGEISESDITCIAVKNE